MDLSRISGCYWRVQRWFWCIWIWQKSSKSLTHLPLMPHICIRKMGHHCFRKWLVACSAQIPEPCNDALLPIGFLGRNVGEVCIGILSFSFKKMHLKMSSAKMVANLFRGWRWVNLMSPVLNGQHLADRIIECSFWKMSSIAQWNLSVTTTSTIKFITCDLFSNVF